jgi:hypothetical protein
MVNCPECGKPLKKDSGKAKYCCENSACSVIFVRHTNKHSIMKIAYKASGRARVNKHNVYRARTLVKCD